MLHLRRSTAVVLLVGAAVVPGLAAAPAYAVAPSPTAVSTVAAGWTYYATYPDHASCLAAGPANPFGARTWECRAAAGGYELWVLI
jgi:hypothetical protein